MPTHDEIRVSLIKTPQLIEACNALKRIFSEPWQGEKLAKDQIRNAARKTVELVGYDWIYKKEMDRNERINTALKRREIRIAMSDALSLWHKDPTRVWRTFKKHSLELAAGKEARKLIHAYRLSQ